MTRQTRMRKEIKETTEVVREEKTDFELSEVEIEGVRCDFCDQWYADDEDVGIMEMYENPSVAGLPSGPMRLYELLRHIDIREITTRVEGHMAGSAKPLGYEAYATRSKPHLLQKSLKEFVESRGGPRKMSEWYRREDINAAAAHGRIEEYDEGDVIFGFDLDLDISGRVLHMCEYCRGARKND